MKFLLRFDLTYVWTLLLVIVLNVYSTYEYLYLQK